MVDAASNKGVIDGIRGALAVEPRVRWAYAFGSLARGEAFRDVDVAVRVEPGAFPTLADFGELARLVSDASGIGGLDVDLVDVEACALPLLARIFDEGILLVDRAPEERRLWEGEKTLRWLDFKPTWEAQARLRRQASSRRG